MLVYRFDNEGAFPVLDSVTTARGPVSTAVIVRDGAKMLRVLAERGADDTGEVDVAVALPLRTIDREGERAVRLEGEGGRFVLDVIGDGSGCRVWIEATDPQGGGLSYALSSVDYEDRRSCVADILAPARRWGERSGGTNAPVELPLQLEWMGITLPPACDAIDICFVELRVSQGLRVISGGIADA